jgi:hypothetical protein
MQRSSFILGVALFVVAATHAITITLRKPPESELVSSNPSATKARDARLQRSPSIQSGAKTPGKRANRPAAAAPAQFSVSVPSSHPASALLAEKAQKVEAEALAHLDKLTARLDLTAKQRRKLFPILARTSNYYDPALTISDLPAGAPALVGVAGDREFNQVLDPSQKDQLIEDAIADQVLWEEIIGKLRQRLDQETPLIPDGAPTDVEPPAPTPRGRGNLFESINPE